MANSTAMVMVMSKKSGSAFLLFNNTAVKKNPAKQQIDGIIVVSDVRG